MRLSQFRNLIVEDFPDQKAWIEKLISPINKMLEEVFRALDKGLNTADNEDAQIRKFRWDGKAVDLSWGRPNKPIGLWVIDIVDVETGSKPTLTVAPFVSWDFTSGGAIKVSYVLGVTGSETQRYEITVKIVTG